MDGQVFEYWVEEQLEVGDSDCAVEPGTARFSTPVGTSIHNAQDALRARVALLQRLGWHVESLGGETFTAAKNDCHRTLWLSADVRTTGGAA